MFRPTPAIDRLAVAAAVQRAASYSGADPGGWGWTDLPGSVPDADDTPGALLALAHLSKLDGTTSQIEDAAEIGVQWLLDLQNSDGGWPTFCRGWGNLPFDRSGADLTAHVLRALAIWASVEASARRESQPSKRPDDPSQVTPVTRRAYASTLASSKVQKAIANGLAYLIRFNAPTVPGCRSGSAISTLPTTRTQPMAPPCAGAYRDLDMMNTEPARQGVAWLLSAQNDDGGWGGSRGTPSSMEETALAVDVLLDVVRTPPRR